VSCDHFNTHSNVAVYRIPNDARPEAPFFQCVIKVMCADCGASFRFLGDHKGVPEDAQEALRRRVGCWTSPIGDELGCMIAPFSVNPTPLEVAAVAGRA
jgi:hypothetical protein